MRTDRSEYYVFTSKARLDKAVNSLLGLVEGIGADQVVTKEGAARSH